MRLIDRIFSMEEINGHNACETYMYRWTLIKLFRGIGLYLHHIVGSDWTRDLHDHPKRFISIGLKGWYIEETEGTAGTLYTAPWVRTFPATHRHRLVARNCWTLVLVLWTVRPWGFWSRGTWIPWRQYVGSKEADRARDC